MTSLIILSTMFLKQHSVVDVLTALILSCLSYDFIYNERTEKIRDGLEELKFHQKTQRIFQILTFSCIVQCDRIHITENKADEEV